MKINLFKREQSKRAYLVPGIAAAGAMVCGMFVVTAHHPIHAASRRAQAAGAAVFHDKGCQHCHGLDATGTDRGPDLSTVGKKWHKDRIEQQIRAGGGGMPAFGDVLQPDEIKSLVDFLGAKRKPAEKLPAAEKTPAVTQPSSDDSSY